MKDTTPHHALLGRILTPGELATITESFARWLGVGPRGVIVVPAARIQPVPRPLQHHRDGRGRLPPGVTPEGARHPVWWLDAQTKWQDPDEDDVTYALRLTETMTDRGLVLDGDGPVDVLAWHLGWSIGAPTTDARIRAYAAGGWDSDLCGLELTTDSRGTLPDRAARKRRARQQRRLLPGGPSTPGPDHAADFADGLDTVAPFPD